MTVHAVVVILAALAVTFAARYPVHSSASPAGVAVASQFSFSGLAGSVSTAGEAYLRPGGSALTRDSVSALLAPSDVTSVRAAGGVSPTSSFSSGVALVTAASGEQGAGIKPLADIIDPRQPFVLYETQSGDSVSLIAEKYGIKLRTLLDNNPTVGDGKVIQKGQQLVVPRKDGILYKVGYGDTVDKIVGQYDNITSSIVLDYKPNAIGDPNKLNVGDYVLLPGATIKPPPPPPPAPKPVPKPSGPITGSGGTPANSGGRFSFPLAAWNGVSDSFGIPRGGGTYHTGIDLMLFGYHHSNIFSACAGVVSKVEYLTYSYGYHVIVDCGDGWSTLYAHMDQINVAPGQKVSQGTVLGISGVTGFTTGEHLHFEIRLNGAPVDPALYLGF